jgi:outer membrane protein
MVWLRTRDGIDLEYSTLRRDEGGMLKIEIATETPTGIVYNLSGRIDAEHLAELRALLAAGRHASRKVIFDFQDVDAVDRDTVRFFVRGAGRQAHLLHCPAYVKEWCRVEARRKPALRVVKPGGAAALAFLLLVASARAQSAASAEPLRLSLRDAVARGLSEGTAEQIASERAAQSRAQADQARASLLPQVDAEVQDLNEILNLKTFGLTLPGVPALVGPFNVFDAHVRVAARLIDVAAYRRWRAARQGIVVSDAERRTTENQVAAAVATLYVAIQRADASIEASRANVELSQKLFDLADDQRKAGVATRIDSTRAAVALSRQRQLLLLAENRANAARLALARAIGLDLGVRLLLTDPLQDEPGPLPTPDDAFLAARRYRPELRVASERLRQVDLALSADRAERLPSLGAQFQGGYNGNHLGDLDWNRVFGATLSVPIFTGGRVAARIAEDESRRREALLQERDTEHQVEEDVRQALLNYENARSRAVVAEESDRLARQELEYARDRFVNGITSSIEVDNAQASLTGTQEDRIAALADEAQARFDLARATGAIRDLIPSSTAAAITAR